MDGKLGKLILLAIFLTFAVAAQSTSAKGMHVETALAINKAASSQAESASKLATAQGRSRDIADAAFQDTYLRAVWNAVRLAMPKAPADERESIVNLIESADAMGDQAAGSELADAAMEGDWSKPRMQAADRLSDDAFRFGYKQGLNRLKQKKAKGGI